MDQNRWTCSIGIAGQIPSDHMATFIGITSLIVIDRDMEDNDKEKNKKENIKILKALTQETAKAPDETKNNISLNDIEKVVDGEIVSKRGLLIFGKNLETVLSKKVTDWSEILKLLRGTYNLPTDKAKPGPRDIQALGLAYTGEYGDNSELENLFKTLKPKLDKLSETFNTFIKQETEKPQLLIPKEI